jgi:hypothetical protein
MDSTRSLPSEEATALNKRIRALEEALRQSEIREDVKGDLYAELVVKYNSLLERANREVAALKERITELETGGGRYHTGLEWLGKVVFILRRTGRPLKARELVEAIARIDPALRKRANPPNFLSAVLSEGVKAGRLLLHKVKGTRGGYYVLEEWTDEQGNLDVDMKSELL